MDDFEIDGRLFRAEADGYYAQFHDFRIRVREMTEQAAAEVYGLPRAGWVAETITGGGKIMAVCGSFSDKKVAAKFAIGAGRDHIEESDRLDAEDSDRERREFEREQRLSTRDVL
jgi:hypothetical protein